MPSSFQVNDVEDGNIYPCQPIGCDAGFHVPGCLFENADQHAGLGLPCDICPGPCRIDGPSGGES